MIGADSGDAGFSNGKGGFNEALFLIFYPWGHFLSGFGDGFSLGLRFKESEFTFGEERALAPFFAPSTAHDGGLGKAFAKCEDTEGKMGVGGFVGTSERRPVWFRLGLIGHGVERKACKSVKQIVGKVYSWVKGWL